MCLPVYGRLLISRRLSRDIANSVLDPIADAQTKLNAKLDDVSLIVKNLTNILDDLVHERNERNEAKGRGNNASDLE